jgi:hypothetical protein
VLRENAILPRLVNRSYEANVAEFGDTIDIPYVGLATAVTVTPGPTYTNVDMTTSKVQIALNWWRKASFVLTDKEIEEAISGSPGSTPNAGVLVVWRVPRRSPPRLRRLWTPARN